MRLRPLAVVSVAVVVLLVVVGLASATSGGGTLAVSVSLTQPKIHAGSKDRATVMNDSGDWLTYGGCVTITPRVGSVFKLPSNSLQCLAYVPIAPHSRFQIPFEPGAFRAKSPGKYWVAVLYFAGKGQAPLNGAVRVAYTKLTVTN
jgi:hypothetical protein